MPTNDRTTRWLWLLCCPTWMLWAQPILDAQVVQLPGVRTFSSTGSVLVPDGGTAYLGGNSYGGQSVTRSGGGLTSGRSIAGGYGGSSLSVSAEIIDLQALDEAILNGATSSMAGTGSAAVPQGAFTRAPSNATTNPTSPRVHKDPGAWQRALSGSVNAPETLSSDDPAMLESDLRYYMQRAEQAEKAGSLQAARVYYNLARKAMSPQLLARYQDILEKRKATPSSSTPTATDAPPPPAPDSRQF